MVKIIYEKNLLKAGEHLKCLAAFYAISHKK